MLMSRRGLSLKCSCYRYFSTASSIAPSNTVKLAYKLHLPRIPSDKTDVQSPLIIMHGLFGSKANWQSLAEAFANDLDRSVYCLDARNHGESPHDAVHNYDVMAEDVKGFIQDRKLKDAIVVGHSMGAKTAMILAIRYPELVKLLVPVDNAPIDAMLTSEFPRYVRAMRDIELRGVQKQSEADALLQETEQDLSIRQFLLTNLVKRKQADGSSRLQFRIPIGILAKSLDYMGDFPILPDEARFVKPTCFIRGSKSKYVADETIPLIGRYFPRFQIKDIDAGHWVQAEKPAEFKQVLETFIRDEEEKLGEQRQEEDDR
ncbi:alpha beta hydrolase fold family [Protomyces lactucae-debilis]|uniref:Alpha beta hydrolase fold family n=1 Tax=Protomyces lactucae-debilis TaxID=2754530 RepID=A0A1Y2FRU4_PROLT|nr:alpha beta hydrolase fold family [Protomyces lactucae-debilis]ORY86307.1 alpha beta hydrolase fold family [Protomyces lactucae-debilis]